MKKQLNSITLGNGYALFFTILGYIIGIPSFIAFDTTDLWSILLVIAASIAFITYIVLARMVDSAGTFARAVLNRHTIVSVVSIILSLVLCVILDSRLGLYVLCLAFGIALAGYIPSAFHLAVCALQKRMRN